MKSNFTLSTKLIPFFLFVFINFSVSLAQNATIPLPNGGFQIDGDLEANTPPGTGDWIPGPSGSGGHVFDLNGVPLDPITTYRFIDSYKPDSDNIFTSGKFDEDPNVHWTWTIGSAAGKGDINNVLIHLGSESISHDQWLIIASDRLVTNGTSYIDFEFFQNTLTTNLDGSFSLLGGRKINDILLSVSYTNGGTNPTVIFHLWNGTSYELVSSTSAFGQTNMGVVNTIAGGAFGSSQYTPFQFVEAAINISAFLNLVNPCAGGSFGSALVKTKSSASSSAALDDFAGPYPIQLNLGTATISGGPFCKNDINAKVKINGIQGGTFSAPSGLVIGSTDGIIDLTTSATGTYTVTYSYTTGGCPKTTTTDITINPTPTVLITDPSSVCLPSTVDLTSATITEGSTAGLTFTYWTDATATNTYTTPTTATAGTYYIKGTTAAGCFDIKAVTVSQRSTPVATATPASQTICSAESITTMVLSGSVSGTTFNWTRNNTLSVTGIAASGSGDISGSLTNTTAAPVTVTFTITPTANDCEGTPIYASVLVNPTPDAIATPASQIIASEETITPIVINGSISETTFSWTRNNSTSVTGIAANGSGDISGNLTNTTNSPLTVTFTIIPMANNCEGMPIIAKVTVNPIPDINPDYILIKQTTCSGEMITPIVLLGSVNETAFNWTRDNNATVTGIAASGSGDINGSLTNTTNAPVTVTFNITPTANETIGTPITTTVVVNPTAQVNKPDNQIICNGGRTTAVTFTTINTGGTMTYTWTNNLSSIGLPTIGSGDIASFIATNLGSVPVTATIIVTPHFTNSEKTCDGPTKEFTITVNPTLASTISGITGSICLSSSDNFVAPEGSNYMWTISGNGNIAGVSNSKNISVLAGTLCNQSYNLILNFTDINGCLAHSEKSVLVNDSQAPVITVPSNKTVACDAVPSAGIATDASVTDNCSSKPTVSYLGEVRTNGNCPNNYTLTRTWKAEDACGNSATKSQTITVQDLTAPTTSTSFLATIDAKCDAIPAKPTLVFVDNCSAVVTPVYSEKMINKTTTSYSIIRQWDVSDACGNQSKFVQTVNVTITNAGATIESSACNASASTVDLNSLLPIGTPANGTWLDNDKTSALQGSIFSPLDVPIGNYVFEYKISEGDCPLSILVNMNINFDCKVLACESILVHNAFTPNGDGINDLFTVDGINDKICYPDNTVEIYNRWGILVFETQNYNNTSNAFDGTSHGRTTIKQSEGLPDGTYYYILNYTSFDRNGVLQNNKKAGYLFLTR